MSIKLAHIWRHPIKGIGHEAVNEVALTAHMPMPEDRKWALLTEAAEDVADWQPRKNFLVVANGPKLAQITTRRIDEDIYELTHPQTRSLRLDANTGEDALREWIAPLWPDTAPAAARLIKAPSTTAMSDNGKAQISIGNLASLRDLSQKAGMDLDPRRFRINLWIDGAEPWCEFDWVQTSISMGEISFDVTDRIERCRAVEANPENGTYDVDLVRVIYNHWAHRDFGVYATVTKTGTLRLGDELGPQ